MPIIEYRKKSIAPINGVFLPKLEKGMSKPEALRQAQIDLKSIPQYSHPYYWHPL
jgi:CHAT domain-containing protein